ncbi:hypothetical protein V6N13_106746 [Hibiscus sabdariffa]
MRNLKIGFHNSSLAWNHKSYIWKLTRTRNLKIGFYNSSLARNHKLYVWQWTSLVLVELIRKADILTITANGEQSHEQQSQLSSKNINRKKVQGVTLINVVHDREQIVENFNNPRVNLDQLKKLVEYWLSSKGQSATNKSNGSKLEEPYCTGTRSFPRIVEDLTKESNEIPPTRADVYIKSHTRKDGSFVNFKAVVVVINESSSSENLSQTSWSNDVFAQLKDRKEKGVFIV